MNKRSLILVGVGFLLILLTPLVLRKRTVPLISQGRIVGVAKRPFGLPWGDVGVYVQRSKVFSLWGGDLDDGPLLIYPFRNEERFLCVYDYDVEAFAFVVDLSPSHTNTSKRAIWPSDDFNRAAFARWATNVVLETRGVVRLPDLLELQEVFNDLAKLNQAQLDIMSFPGNDLGFCRFYVPKETLLSNLRTNRQF
jgi:hypothetical protein